MSQEILFPIRTELGKLQVTTSGDYDARERRVLMVCNGKRTTSEIAKTAVVSDSDCARLLDALIQKGWIETLAGSKNSARAHASEAPQPALNLTGVAKSLCSRKVSGVTVSLSEAIFYINNFLIDAFGTKAKNIMSEIDSCKSPQSLADMLNALHTAVAQAKNSNQADELLIGALSRLPGA